MGRRKIPNTVYLRPDQGPALVEVAKRLEVTSAALVREGIDLVLARYRDTPALDWVETARVGSGHAERAAERATEGA